MVGPLLTLLAVAAYGALHSILAAPVAKRLAHRWFGSAADRLYRLVYNLVAAISLLPVLAVLALAPGSVLYRVPSPWWLLTAGSQIAALLLLILGLLETDVWHFIGFRQLSEAKDGEAHVLVVTGLYRWVRHPLYSAGLLLIWLSPVMTTSLLAFNSAFTIYVLIAIRLEERRLLTEFGPAYDAYRRRVHALIPLPSSRFSA